MATDIWSIAKMNEICKIRVNTTFLYLTYLQAINTLSDCNRNRNQDHLVRKRTLNHLTKLTSLAKWLSVHVRTK